MLFCLLLIPFATACGPAEISPGQYINQVLDIMETNALHKDSIPWAKVREETLARARGAKTTFDTYPAIAYALTQLKEHHSLLELPDSLPTERKQALTAEIRKVLARPRPAGKPSPFMPSTNMQGHVYQRDGMVFAHIVVPMCIGRYTELEKNADDFQQFADKLHGTVMDLQLRKPNGWIVDLRGNGGGNVWPMLAGIGALLGEGDAGKSAYPDGTQTQGFYKAGKAGIRWLGQESVLASIQKGPFAFSPLPAVAVLFDRGTASSGEGIAIAFAGRPRSRSFGEHTAGLTTANAPYPLSDGAVLHLSTSVGANRTGKLYRDGLDPDVVITEPETRPAEGQDAAIQAAEDWLGQEGSR